MPELPEVETTRRGIAPYLQGETIQAIIVRESRLRWPVPGNLQEKLPGQTIKKISRRAKYIIFQLDMGYLILHLGMSGSLRIITEQQSAGKHDHVDIVFMSGMVLRFRDPRRFGSIHWTESKPEGHALLKSLGPEPLSDVFSGEYLYNVSRGRNQSVKTFIMNSRIVVGIGNIYACEALFAAGIHPQRRAGNISRPRYEKLVSAVKEVLQLALASGGTTLRDFVNGRGEPGYFRHELKVYDRAGLPCVMCQTPLKLQRIGQRSTVYCGRCQH